MAHNPCRLDSADRACGRGSPDALFVAWHDSYRAVGNVWQETWPDLVPFLDYKPRATVRSTAKNPTNGGKSGGSDSVCASDMSSDPSDESDFNWWPLRPERIGKPATRYFAA